MNIEKWLEKITKKSLENKKVEIEYRISHLKADIFYYSETKIMVDWKTTVKNLQRKIYKEKKKWKEVEEYISMQQRTKTSSRCFGCNKNIIFKNPIFCIECVDKITNDRNKNYLIIENIIEILEDWMKNNYKIKLSKISKQLLDMILKLKKGTKG